MENNLSHGFNNGTIDGIISIGYNWPCPHHMDEGKMQKDQPWWCFLYLESGSNVDWTRDEQRNIGVLLPLKGNHECCSDLKPQTCLPEGACENKATGWELAPEGGFRTGQPHQKFNRNGGLWRCKQALGLQFCSWHAFLRCRLALRPGEGGPSCWDNRLPDSLLRYLDAIPHELHGGKLGLDQKPGVWWLGLAGNVFRTLYLHATICSCLLHLAHVPHHWSLQGIAGPSVSKTWERPNLTLDWSLWS